jgi:hypothetical protein
LGVKEVMSTTNITRVNVRRDVRRDARNARNARSGVKNGVKRVTNVDTKGMVIVPQGTVIVPQGTVIVPQGMVIVHLMTIKDMANRITMVTARVR